MTKQIGLVIIISTLILFNSCGKTEQQIKDEKVQVNEQKMQRLKIENEKAISALIKKRNAVSEWENLETYTYVLQEMFIDENKPISFEGKIMDIIRSDSTYLLKVYDDDWLHKRDYLAQISMSKDKFSEIIKVLITDNHSNEGCFVFKVSSIIPSSPRIISDFEFNGDGPYSYLDFDFNKTLLIFKGDLLDFYINEIVPKDNE